MSPERVTEEFKRLARAAGLPVIKLHEARHTAATLAPESGPNVKTVSTQLGHADEHPPTTRTRTFGRRSMTRPPRRRGTS
ncbi:tyrosine-type recombinase/integrase [Microtetraspora fusca]|uniref:tyrosine-type recombinase/integrase n=1 Tax=Microtetraspora fusca TaxID=1997 RepID=UPI000A972224